MGEPYLDAEPAGLRRSPDAGRRRRLDQIRQEVGGLIIKGRDRMWAFAQPRGHNPDLAFGVGILGIEARMDW